MAFTTTAKYALRRLTGGSLASDIDAGFTALADDVDAAMAGWSTGTYAARPAAGKAGRFYLTTDTATLYLDTGSVWLPQGAAPGFIQAMALAFPLTGWTLCDGVAISRTGIYAALFAAIGTVYGVGNGSTTFNPPDLVGRVPIGEDIHGAARMPNHSSVIGSSGGEEMHTLTTGEMPSHTHPYVAPGGAAALYNTGSANQPANPGVASNTTATGGGAAHNNLPPYQIVSYFVKL
jgi:microcystin-dependent protein